MQTDLLSLAEKLLNAYSQGIFPMADSADDPNFHWILPHARAIIPLDERFHVSRSLKKLSRSGKYRCCLSPDFATIVRACAGNPETFASLTCPRESTWINAPIYEVFVLMHQIGYAHAIGVYDRENRLVGGLYGLAINGAFFGESMFSSKRDTSKLALLYLVETLRAHDFRLLDCQFMTDHLAQFGAYEVDKADYQQMLQEALEHRAHALSDEHTDQRQDE